MKPKKEKYFSISLDKERMKILRLDKKAVLDEIEEIWVTRERIGALKSVFAGVSFNREIKTGNVKSLAYAINGSDVTKDNMKRVEPYRSTLLKLPGILDQGDIIDEEFDYKMAWADHSSGRHFGLADPDVRISLVSLTCLVGIKLLLAVEKKQIDMLDPRWLL